MERPPPHINNSGSTLSQDSWLDSHHLLKSQLRTSLVKKLSFTTGEHVLELGCGPGSWSLLISDQIGPRGKLQGIDKDKETIEIAEKRAKCLSRNNLAFDQVDIEEYLATSTNFDTIIAFNVLSYLEDPKSVIRVALEKLKPGGRLIIKDTDVGSDFYWPICPDLYGSVINQVLGATKKILKTGDYNSSFARSIPSILNSIGNLRIQTFSQSFTLLSPLMEEEKYYIKNNAALVSSIISRYPDNEGITKRWEKCFEEGSDCILNSEDFIYSMTEFVFQVKAS